jgi:hypothetical protein
LGGTAFPFGWRDYAITPALESKALHEILGTIRAVPRVLRSGDKRVPVELYERRTLRTPNFTNAELYERRTLRTPHLASKRTFAKRSTVWGIRV